MFLNPRIGAHLYGQIPALQSPAATMWFAHSGAIALPATLLIFVLAFGAGLLSRLLALPLLVLLGEISYSIYLTHWPIAGLFARNKASFAGLPDIIVLALLIATILAISAAIWALIEKPARNVMRGFLTRRTFQPTSSSLRPHLRGN